MIAQEKCWYLGVSLFLPDDADVFASVEVVGNSLSSQIKLVISFGKHIKWDLILLPNVCASYFIDKSVGIS